jgi:hypothetical protein
MTWPMRSGSISLVRQATDPTHLHMLSLGGFGIGRLGAHSRLPESALAPQLSRGRDVLLAALERAPQTHVTPPQTSDEYERLRWFVLPNDVLGSG